MPTSNLLELKNISHTFTLESGRKFLALDSINFTLKEGEALVLIGPSGSGKSTCLRIMAGLIEPSAGEVYLNDLKLSGMNHSLALVFQNFALLPWLSVRDNIAIGLKSKHLPQKGEKERVSNIIDLVGLEGFEEAYPRELSGGMKQRVGLARALIMDRPILALDEPFSALDVLTGESLRKEVLRIWHSRRTKISSLILVTHNIVEAVSMGQKILVMGSNPGHIRYIIENKLPYPRVEKTLEFLRLVENIHDILTEVMLPDLTFDTETGEKISPIEAIPPVTIMEITGLLELVASEGGEISALTLAQKMMRDAVHILLMAHAAEIFQFVDTPKNIIVLTELGRDFIHGDANQRKKIIHRKMLELAIVKNIYDILKLNDHAALPKKEIENKIHSWLPNEAPEIVLDTIIQWGRYGELFGFNSNSQTIYIDQGR